MVVARDAHAREQWLPHTGRVVDLHGVSDLDLAAAAEAVDWAGPANGAAASKPEHETGLAADDPRLRR